MSEIGLIADKEFDEVLQQVHLGELDVVDSRVNERLSMLAELLGVVSDPADDTLSTSGMPWEVLRTVFRSWMLPLMGVVIALIDRFHQLFTYPNEFLVAVAHRGSDKRGSTVFTFNFVFSPPKYWAVFTTRD